MSLVEVTGRDGQNVMAVHDRLRDAILRGEIAPGEATSQVALARQLGVSRTPLREALRLLEREGLVVSQPNRRIRIADFSIADLEALYAMRIALETVAVRLTVPTLGPEQFAELEGLMAQMDHYIRAGDQVRMDVPRPRRPVSPRVWSGDSPRRVRRTQSRAPVDDRRCISR
jgi:DNA-binding GntR family transcriptional regulator